MGMSDVRARFSALPAADGTVAAVIRDACADAAERINDAVQGETTELQAILQFLEQAAHVGQRHYADMPVVTQPDASTEEGGDPDEGEGKPKTKTRSRAKAADKT